MDHPKDAIAPARFSAIVGNAPLSDADRATIAAAETVCRFNLTPNIRSEPAARTTELMLASTSNQIGDYFTRELYRDDPAFATASRIVLPYDAVVVRSCMKGPSLLSRLKGRRADWSDVCIRVAKAHGKAVDIIPAADYFAAARLLGVTGHWRNFIPSSGFLAVQRALKHEQAGAVVHLFGFTFSGWRRHPWAKEQEIVQDGVRAGRLVFHPVAAAQQSELAA